MVLVPPAFRRWLLAAGACSLAVVASSASAKPAPTDGRFVSRLPMRRMLEVQGDAKRGLWVDEGIYSAAYWEIHASAQTQVGPGARIEHVELTPDLRRLVAKVRPKAQVKPLTPWRVLSLAAHPPEGEPLVYVEGKDRDFVRSGTPGDGSLAIGQLNSPDFHRRMWAGLRTPPDLLQRRRGLVRMDPEMARALWTAVREKVSDESSVKRRPDAVSRDGRTAYFHVGKPAAWMAVQLVDGKLEAQRVRPGVFKTLALRRAQRLTRWEAEEFYAGPLSLSGMDEDPFALDP